jgi:transcription elongation factor SPT6
MDFLQDLLMHVSFPDEIAKKFGLTPEQFGENLRDNYQRHEVDQFPSDPAEVAKEVVSE